MIHGVSSGVSSGVSTGTLGLQGQGPCRLIRELALTPQAVCVGVWQERTSW